MRLLVLVGVVGCLISCSWADRRESVWTREKRQARSNVQGCTVNPTGIDDPATPAKEKAQISISCSTDKAYDVCAFQHTKPMDIGKSSSQNNDLATKCVTSGQSSGGQSCPADPRISFETSQSMCGINIGSSDGTDTGKWIVTVGEFNPSGSGGMNSKTMTIYTFNRTTVQMQDDREMEVYRDLDVWFNYDDNEEEWRSGTGGYENVIIQCNAKGGRPEPVISWMINNDDRNSFGGESRNTDADNVFNTKDSLGNTYDAEGYIRDKLSRLSFDVNREFLEYLTNKHGIDTNPSSGSFTFDLGCLVQQGTNGEYSSDRTSVRVKVNRVYFTDSLTGETIGMIVGIVLAVVFVIIVVLILGFAKMTGRWCFEDEEYGYQDPANQKRRPRTAQ